MPTYDPPLDGAKLHMTERSSSKPEPTPSDWAPNRQNRHRTSWKSRLGVGVAIGAGPVLILVSALGKAASLWPYGPVELFWMAFIVVVGIVLFIATGVEIAAGFIIGVF